MDKHYISHSLKHFKRKRKNSFQQFPSEESVLDEDVKPFKRLMREDDYDTYTDSSNSTTPLYCENNCEYETSTNGGLSSDDSEFKNKPNFSDFKSKPKTNGSMPYYTKSEKSNTFLSQSSIKSSRPMTMIDDYYDSGEQDTFRVDMSRYQYFNTSASSVNSYLHSDFKTSLDSPSYKIPPSSTPPRSQNPRRNRSYIYKPHRHNKNVPITHVPCKGPACTSQICCAQFCSQKCFDNQKPIGSGSNFKASLPDYDSCGQQEIHGTDYGLPYPDHTYCSDHKDIYFTADANIDRPPYFDLVESIFYDEKESRIKNPMPMPNVNGDPISSNGYISQTTKRGRPKRSNVVGLLNAYIFHPSSEVIYTPFVFKECIIEADRASNELRNLKPIEHALRQCSNLYKDVRDDIPKDVLYGGGGGTSHSNIGGIDCHDNNTNVDVFDDLVKQECCSNLIDDLFDSPADF